MKTNYLEIQGLKCFVKAQIPLEQLTVLAGGNSVGKSTVIQSLLLLKLAIENDKISMNRIPLNGEFCLELGNSISILCKNAESEEIIISHNSYFDKVHKQELVNREIQAIFYPNTRAEEVSMELKLENNPTLYKYRHLIPASPLESENIHYLNAERLGPRPFYEVKDFSRNVGWQGERTISLLSWPAIETKAFFVEETKRHLRNTFNPSFINQVEVWMNYIIPGVEINPEKIREANLSYVQYGGSSPHNVGFSISYVLPIIVAGLIAKKGEMLIVENPEAHLHPSGQSRIGRFLAQMAQAGIHIVVETHSEHVINGIRIAALEETIDHDKVVINFFSPSEDINNPQPEIKSIFLNEKADLDEWPKGFFDRQQADIAQIFRLRKQMKK